MPSQDHYTHLAYPMYAPYRSGARAWPRTDMDHVNGDRADNRWCNLREATQSQNQANTSMRADNISGYKGVCWHKGHRKWTAKIQVSGERRYLGYFDTPERAFIAYMFARADDRGDI